MMSAKCPLICSAVELWYKMMLEIRNQSDLTENHIKRKAAGYQRLSSTCLWLVMAVYKPSFSLIEGLPPSVIEAIKSRTGIPLIIPSNGAERTIIFP